MSSADGAGPRLQAASRRAPARATRARGLKRDMTPPGNSQSESRTRFSVIRDGGPRACHGLPGGFLWTDRPRLTSARRRRSVLAVSASRASSASTAASRGGGRRRPASWAGAWTGRSRRGPWTTRSRPADPAPRNRLTRSRISALRCWIRVADGPATRISRTPGVPPRGEDSFTGSVRRARSAPTISGHRACRAPGPCPNRSSSALRRGVRLRPAGGAALCAGRVRRRARISAASARVGSLRLGMRPVYSGRRGRSESRWGAAGAFRLARKPRSLAP